MKHSKASPSCAVSALVYLERFSFRYPALLLTNRSLQRLVLVAVMTATKFLEDECPSNRCWCSAIRPPSSKSLSATPHPHSAPETCCFNRPRRAEIGGLALRELNALERAFLSAIGFRLAIHPDAFAACAEDHAAFAAGRRVCPSACAARLARFDAARRLRARVAPAGGLWDSEQSDSDWGASPEQARAGAPMAGREAGGRVGAKKGGRDRGAGEAGSATRTVLAAGRNLPAAAAAATGAPAAGEPAPESGKAAAGRTAAGAERKPARAAEVGSGPGCTPAACAAPPVRGGEGGESRRAAVGARRAAL